jgi:hypothetical protein
VAAVHNPARSGASEGPSARVWHLRTRTRRSDKKLDTSTGLIEMGVRPGGEHDEVEQRLKSAAAR